MVFERPYNQVQARDMRRKGLGNTATTIQANLDDVINGLATMNQQYDMSLSSRDLNPGVGFPWFLGTYNDYNINSVAAYEQKVTSFNKYLPWVIGGGLALLLLGSGGSGNRGRRRR